MKYNKLWPILSLALLAACDPYEQAVETIEENHQKASEILDHAKEGNAYLGKVQEPITSIKSKPLAWLDEPTSLVVQDGNFSYILDELIEDKNLNVMLKEGIDPNKKVSLKFTGTVREALDYLADIADYGYQIEGNMITWSPFIVQTFDINFLPADTHFSMGSGTIGSSGSGTTGANGGATGANGAIGGTGTTGATGTNGTTNGGSSLTTPAGTSTITSQGNLWKEIEEGVKELLSSEGKMKLSKALTMITVRDHPSNMKMVRQYLNHLNKTLGSQVMIKVMILDVTLNEEFKFGIDWQMIASNIGGTKNAINFNLPTFDPSSSVIGSQAWRGTTAGTGVMATMNNGGLRGTKAFLTALEGQGNVSIVTEPVTVTMNNQVAELNIVTDTVYIASASSNVIAGAGGANTTSNSLTPGVITTGLSLYLLPKIFEDGVYLQINAIMSALNGTIPTVDTGTGTTVGTPQTSSKKFNQRSVVKNGETLIISGFKENATTTGDSSEFGLDFLGNKSSKDNKREIVMLITPYVITPAPDAEGGNILASGNIEQKKSNIISKGVGYVKAAIKGTISGVERFVEDVPSEVKTIASDVGSDVRTVAADLKTDAKAAATYVSYEEKSVGSEIKSEARSIGQSIEKWI